MKLKNKLLYSNTFNSALGKILNQDVPVETGFQLNTLLDSMQKPQETLDKTRKGLVEKYCELDEKGNAKIEDNRVVFKDEESGEKFEKEFNDLMELEFEVPVDKITLGSNIKLQPVELRAIIDVVRVPEKYQVKKDSAES